MAAFTVFENRIESVLLEQFNSLGCNSSDHIVVFSNIEPEQLESLFQRVVVEHREIAIFPTVGVWRRRGRWRCCRIATAIAARCSGEFPNQAGAEDADIGKAIQARNPNIESLRSAHR